MIEIHPAMTSPHEDNHIWRYMDFTKFMSMLETKSLYFCRIDKLEDKFEGTFSKPSFLPDSQKEIKAVQAARKQFFINCWHVNDHESAAMWKLYLKSNEGLAIKTTFKRLSESLSALRYPIYPANVVYLDYQHDPIPSHNAFYPVLCKRKSFEHENELRLICHDVLRAMSEAKDAGLVPENPPSGFVWPPLNTCEQPGFNVPIDLETVIEEVYVAPSSPEWFRELVESVMANRFSISRTVRKSNLDSDPVF